MRKRVQRRSIAAEAYGKWNKLEPFKVKPIPKTEEQKKRIKSKLLMTFIFANVEQKELEVILNAMEEQKVEENTVVIKEGDAGSCLYIVESGTLICTKKFVIQN